MKIAPISGTLHPATPRGFTLVELLVVITIILVLAFLSTLGVTRIRSTARGATCTSNLRQISAAMLSYATDKSGQLPPLEDRTGSNDGLKGIWTQIIADGGYLNMAMNPNGQLGCGAGVWTCPDCTNWQRFHSGYGAVEGTVMQVKKGSVPSSGSSYLANIPNPERTWLVGDVANKAPDLKTSWYATWANTASWGARTPAARHGGKVNVCMVDGHVESLTVKELKAPGKNYTMSKP
jgi:prepilin-type N-terminal cleavage/methylation domain-containing protein/prepilin-type processing-associated H-X9-DG protein